MTEIKSANIQVKATEDSGYFKAVVSVFDTVDSYSDVMVKGSFANTLQEWKASGTNIPVLWSHDLSDPFAHIGEVTSATETPEGLEVEGLIDLENPTGKQAHKLIKGRRVKEWSFGFIVRDSEMSKKDGEPVRLVKDVELLEVSMTLIGANRNTRTVDVKSAPEQSEEKNAVVEDTTSFSVADLDNAIELFESLSVAANETLLKLTKTRDSFTTKDQEEEVAEEVVEVEEIDEQAVASSDETPEDLSEGKGVEDGTAAAKAQDFELQNTIIELERMLSE